ncbi:MAG: hypothetical protein UY79_C0009G0006 [Parcubacteria group bacterium GW2011_GWA2_53_21]|nr:MAG: hypothetical protein UY79_C0009G0006 [Parcubacteria group bacterium GW2011_GWA2_53_21]
MRCDGTAPNADLVTESARPSLQQALRSMEDAGLNLDFLLTLVIQEVLLRNPSLRKSSQHNKLQAALMIGIPRPTFCRWLDRGWHTTDPRFSDLLPKYGQMFARFPSADLAWEKIRLEAVREALRRTNNNLSRAARLAGVNRQTVKLLVRTAPDLAPQPAASSKGDGNRQ